VEDSFLLNNFNLSNKFQLSTQSFEISKIKIDNSNYLFVNTDTPYFLYYFNDGFNFSNFNFKSCLKIFNIASEQNFFLFMKNNQLILGSIEHSSSKNIISKQLNKQIYNLSYIKDYEIICFTSDEYNMIGDSELINTSMQIDGQMENISKAVSTCKLNFWDRSFNEISSYHLDKQNESCHSFIIIDFNRYHTKSTNIDELINENKFDDKKNKSNFLNFNLKINKISSEKTIIEGKSTKNYLFESDLKKNLDPLILLLGTSINDRKQSTPLIGHIIILEYSKLKKFIKLFEIEVSYPIFKLEYLDNLLISASNTALFAYKINLKNIRSNELIDLSNESHVAVVKSIYSDCDSLSDFYSIELKEIRKCNEFNFIYDIFCHKDFILISDINKSVSFYKYNREKDSFVELCKDYNPMFVVSINKSSRNHYTLCDFYSNIYKMRKEVYSKDDSEKHK